MTNISVLPNQSMLDVIVQATGSLEAGMQFCWDNGVSISDTPAVGTVYTVTDDALALGDAGNLKYLVKNGIVVATLGEAMPENGLLNDDGTPLLNDDGAALLNDN